MCQGIVGQGATLVLSVDSTIWKVRGIQLGEWASEMVDITELATTGFMCKIPANITDPGDFTAELVFDPEVDIPTMNAIQTATITFPIANSANSTPGTLAGSGAITSIAWPALNQGEAAFATITFSFDGETGPALQVETT